MHGDNHIWVPTLGIAPVGRMPSGEQYVSLAQKLCIIRPDLLVAWSGPREIARNTLWRLKQHPWSDTMTHEEPADVLKTLEYDDLGQLQLLWATIDAEKRWRVGGLNVGLEIHSQMFGKILASGSGSAMSELRREIEAIESSQGGAPETPERPGDHLALVLGVIGRFLAAELFSRRLSDSWFGGFFEVAFVRTGQFAKLDDVTYMFWAYDVATDYLRIIPPVLIVDYVDEAIWLTRLDFTPQEQFSPFGRPLRGVTPQWVIPPAYADSVTSASVMPPTYPLNSRHFVHAIAIRSPQGDRFATWSTINQEPDRVRIERSETNFRMTISGRLAEELRMACNGPGDVTV